MPRRVQKQKQQNIGLRMYSYVRREKRKQVFHFEHVCRHRKQLMPLGGITSCLIKSSSVISLLVAVYQDKDIFLAH